MNMINKLKNKLNAQTRMFTKISSVNESVFEASLETSYILAKNMKPFSDGEMIKEILTEVTNIMFPEKADMVSKISLSRHTVERRVEDLSKDVKKQLITKCEEAQYYSIAIDESTDENDTAQLAVFI